MRTCLAVARGWQAHYMAQREKIEASGHPARWEFSRELLFKRTNHIAEVRMGGMGGHRDRAENAAVPTSTLGPGCQRLHDIKSMPLLVERLS